jgi:hypothetical protein
MGGYGTNENNETDEKSLNFRLFRYFRLFRILASAHLNAHSTEKRYKSWRERVNGISAGKLHNARISYKVLADLMSACSTL